MGKRMLTADDHRKRIALQTLKLSRTGADMLGGMDHAEALEYLTGIGYSEEALRNSMQRFGHTRDEIDKMFAKVISRTTRR